jgi:hypothetical protein
MKPSPYLEHGKESLLGGSMLSGVLKSVLNVGSDVLGSFLDLLDSRLSFLLAILEDLLKVFKSGGGVSLGLNSFSLVSVSSGIEIVISIHEVFVVFSIEFVININIVFIIIVFDKVFVVSSNNIGDRLDGLHRLGGVSLGDRSDMRSRLNSRSDMRSRESSAVDGFQGSGSNGTVHVNGLRKGLEDRADRSNGTGSVGGSQSGVLGSNLGGSEEIIVFGIEFVIFSIEFIVFSIEFVVFSIEFVININPVFIIIVFDKVFVISSNNIGDRLDGLHGLGGVSLGDRSDMRSRLNSRSGVRSRKSSTVDGSQGSGSKGTVHVNGLRKVHEDREGLEDRSNGMGNVGHSQSGVLGSNLGGSEEIIVFGIEFVIFSIEFIIFGIEFIVFGIEFVININIVFIIIVFDKVLVISSNNLASSVGDRLDGESCGLKRSSMLGRVCLRNRSSSKNWLGSMSAVGRSGSGDSGHVGRSGFTSEGSLSGLNVMSGVGGSFGSVGLLGKIEIIFSKEFIVFGIEFVINIVLIIIEFNKVFVIVLEESGLNLGLSGLGVSGVDRSSSGDLSSGVLTALLSFSHYFNEFRSGVGSGSFSVISSGESGKTNGSNGLDGSGGVGRVGGISNRSGESESKIVILEFRGSSSETSNGKESDGFLHLFLIVLRE